MQLHEITLGMTRGDETAYSRFHQQYHARIYRYVYVLVSGRNDEALDITQETLLRVIRHIREFHSEDIFWDWLTCLARSAAEDQRRKSGRWNRWLRQLWTPPPAIPPRCPEVDVTSYVQRAVALLPADDQALLAAKYSGRTTRELALEQGQTEGAIESRLVRLRARIREQVLEWRRHEAE